MENFRSVLCNLHYMHLRRKLEEYFPFFVICVEFFSNYTSCKLVYVECDLFMRFFFTLERRKRTRFICIFCIQMEIELELCCHTNHLIGYVVVTSDARQALNSQVHFNASELQRKK